MSFAQFLRHQGIKFVVVNPLHVKKSKEFGQTRITKLGRPRLRVLLYAAIRPTVAKNDEFKALHEYMTTRRDNPLKKQQSFIAQPSH